MNKKLKYKKQTKIKLKMNKSIIKLLLNIEKVKNIRNIKKEKRKI